MVRIFFADRILNAIEQSHPRLSADGALYTGSSLEWELRRRDPHMYDIRELDYLGDGLPGLVLYHLLTGLYREFQASSK
jgi:hypothetical protein